MAQHDYNIANQTASATRSDLNNVLTAIVSNNSGATAPTTTYANQWWYDTTNNILKIRNEADSAWINVALINQGSSNTKPYIDGVQVSFKDEDTMSSNSATSVASQQSIKAYVDGGATLANPTSNIEFRNGLIVKTGQYTSNSDTNIAVTFPTPFPTACLAVLNGGSPDSGITSDIPWTANAITASGFNANRDDSVNFTFNARYIAVGF